MTLEIVTVLSESHPPVTGWRTCCVGCVVRAVKKLSKDWLLQFGGEGDPFWHTSAPELILAVRMAGYQVRVITFSLPERAKPFMQAGSIQDIHIETDLSRWKTPGNWVLIPNGEVYHRMDDGRLGNLLGNVFKDGSWPTVKEEAKV